LKFFQWLTLKGIQVDDIDKMEQYIADYQKYQREKEYAERLEGRNEEYKKDIAEHSEPPRPADWWKEKQRGNTEPPPKDEGDINIPFYNGEFHDRR